MIFASLGARKVQVDYKNTYNCIKYFIISGDPYPKISHIKKTNFERKIHKLKDKGKKTLFCL